MILENLKKINIIRSSYQMIQQRLKKIEKLDQNQLKIILKTLEDENIQPCDYKITFQKD